MSDYNASSFDTNECNDQIWTPPGSSQSSQTTKSSFDYTNAFVPQSGNVARDHNLLQNVGYGAPDAYGAVAPDPNTGFGNVYVPPVSAPLPGQYEYNKTYYAGPWSQYTRWKAHGPDPYPVAEASAAQRSQRLAENWVADQAYQYAPMNSLPSLSDGHTPKQWPEHTLYGDAANHAVSQASSSSMSDQTGQSGKLPLPPMQMPLKEEVKEVRYLCPEPGCPESFTRIEGVRRHQKTKHSKGPFWECDICGFWYNQVRVDSMRRHCRDNHPDRIMYDLIKNEDVYPFKLVASVGDRDLISRTSTATKRTRRRRQPAANHDL